MIEEFPALIRHCEVVLMDARHDAPRVAISVESSHGHTSWFLPITADVISRLCQIGEVYELNKLVKRPLIVVRTDVRLHGFKHLTNERLTLLGDQLWGASWHNVPTTKTVLEPIK